MARLGRQYAAKPLIQRKSIVRAAYVLTALSASFAVTGSDVSFTSQRKLQVSAASISISGSSAGLIHGYKLTADAGVFTFSGSNIALLKQSKLSGTAASLLMSGQNISLKKSSIISASAGNLSLSGENISTLITRKLFASSGAMVFNGQSIALKKTSKLSASASGYSFSPSGVSANAARILNTGLGSYILSGEVPRLIKQSILNASAGHAGFGGENTVLEVARLMTVGNATYLLIRNDVSLILQIPADYSLPVDPPAYSFTGHSVNLIKHSKLNPGIAAYQANGIDAGLTAQRKLRSNAGALVLSGENMELLHAFDSVDLSVVAASFAFTGQSINLSHAIPEIINIQSLIKSVIEAKSNISETNLHRSPIKAILLKDSEITDQSLYHSLIITTLEYGTSIH